LSLQAAADDDWMGREDDEDVIIYSQGMHEGMGGRGGWHRQGGEFGDVGDTEAGMADKHLEPTIDPTFVHDASKL
jgi:hypothetical protein